MEQALTIETKQTTPAIIRHLFETTSEKVTNAQSRRNTAKYIAHVGVALVLSNFSLEYMSGEDLLNYIKGTLLATAIVLVSFTTEIKIAACMENNIKSASPLGFGFAKKINHLFCKGDEQHVA